MLAHSALMGHGMSDMEHSDLVRLDARADYSAEVRPAGHVSEAQYLAVHALVVKPV